MIKSNINCNKQFQLACTSCCAKGINLPYVRKHGIKLTFNMTCHFAELVKHKFSMFESTSHALLATHVFFL